MKARVCVVIAAYGGLELLRRCLASLQGQGDALVGVIVVDNRQDAATAEVARAVCPIPVQVITPAENLGTAGGLAAGLEVALADAATTHFWILDDDAQATPGALPGLVVALVSGGAEAASSLVTDADNIVRWFPGPLIQPAWDVIRSGVTPGEFRARCGVGPLRWEWATWASLLVSRRAVETVGLPDARLWYQGTDIEYTLRISAQFPCVLATDAVTPHLPPGQNVERRARKEYWALQNGAYVAVRLPHGHRTIRSLPGNHFRYWRNRGFRPTALLASAMAFWRGAVVGRPVALEDYLRRSDA